MERGGFTQVSIFLLFALLFFFGKESNATHAQGADLTYTCLGNGEYELRASFYRDCEGINAPNSVTVTASSANCGEDFDITLDQIQGTGQDVTPICDGATTECEGGNHPGVEEYVYTGTVTLPQACSDWSFDMSICCRNNAITTIENPGGEDIHLQSELDNLNYPCNSSPSFNNPPVPYICVGETYCFNHGAQDPDGDSLSYSLVAPSTGPNGTVNYDQGYSATQPVSSNPQVSIDSETGDICMTPTQQEVSVLEVRVEEYRNGNLIGAVHRDMQVQVVSCSNQLPSLTGIDGNGDFQMDVCAGENVFFEIPTEDPDSDQDLTLSWDQGISGGQFDPGTGSRPTGEFQWTPNASHVGNGPYCFTVEVKDDNCPVNGSQVYSFCLTVNGIDSLDLSSKPANCGASNGSAHVEQVHGGSGPFSYVWTPDKGNNQSADYQGITADTYTVEVTDANGCSFVDSIAVGPGSLPGNLNINPTDPTCNGGNDGSATVNVQGGKGPYQFSWSNGDTTATADSLSAGTYYVDVVTAEGCHSSDTVTLQDPQAVVISLDSVSEPLCYGDSNGYGEASVQGGQPPYDFEWSTNPPLNGQQVNGLYSGSFTVTVTDGNGCTDEASFTLGQPEPLSSSTNSSNASCHGGKDGSVSVSVNGGTAPYQYDWLGTGSQQQTQNGLSAGQYVVEVSDENGCTIQDTAVVNEPTPLAIDTTDLQNITCNGGDDGSITVEGNGGTPPYNFQWNNPNQSGQTVNNLTAGTYQVELMDDNGCTLVDSFEVQEPAPMQLQVDTVHDVSCNGGSDGSATVSASGGNGGYSYTWDDDNDQTGPTANGLQAGTYQVTAVDAEGCQSTTTVNVNEPLPLQLSLDSTAQPLCNGESNGYAEVSAQGGTAPYSFQWSTNPAQNGQSVSNLQSGSYTVSVTDDNGCADSLSFSLDQPDPMSSSMSATDVQCHGGKDGSATVQVNGGTAPYQYHWYGYGNQQGKTLSGLSAGMYIVQISDENGCSIHDTIVVDEPAPLAIDSTELQDPACNGGDDGSISVSVTGGTAPYSYNWVNSGQGGPQIKDLNAGTYDLEVMDDNGCTVVDKFTLVDPPPVQISVDQVFDVTCNGGENGMATASASGGQGPLTITWDLDSPQTGNNAFDLSAGNYTVTATDTNGCEASASFQVDEPAPMDVSVIPLGDTICPNDTITLSASANGGNGNYFFVWDQGLGVGDTHDVSPNQSTDYSVTAYDSAGCASEEATVHIEVKRLDRTAFEIYGEDEICKGEMAAIGAAYNNEGSKVDFSWDQGIGNGEGPHHVLPNDTTTYSVTVSDPCQNKLTDSVTVAVLPLPEVLVEVPDAEGCGEAGVVCNNKTNPANSTSYEWKFSNGESSQEKSPEIEFTSSGQHSAKLYLTNQHGCENMDGDQFSVEVHPVPSADFEMDPDGSTSIYEPEFAFHYNDPYAYEWTFDFGDGTSSNKRDPVHEYPEVGTYSVTLSAKTINGCTAEKVKEVVVEEEFAYYVPNAFTPDGDGVNDEFDGEGTGYVAREMMIFNRWGELIYESHDPDQGWNGRVNGRKVKPDTYVYKIKVQDLHGKWHEKEGHVTVVR